MALLLIAALFASVMAQSSSSTSKLPAATTVNLFLGLDDSGAPNGLVSSVLHADQCVTATYGPSSYGLSMVGTPSIFDGSDGGTVMRVQTCSLEGTTKAVCSFTTAVELSGKSTATSTIATYTGSDVVYGYRSASVYLESFGMASAATGIGRVYKIIVAPGAAALLARALV
ncbi:uncharacterized protein LTR77_010217 [Saxophila tyrrhenica]|uniref:Dirigent protein n=1 Tax=Saxophila tyrrhenica TaxID=1690608 RepID=A0AAV9NX67_9PEZI|nr:hypothetical protein LTR77_010217 [Saxophila tyrrhenica]